MIHALNCLLLSHPAWDAWIEIIVSCIWYSSSLSLPAWDAWIEIAGDANRGFIPDSRIPHGMRGLKFSKVSIMIFHIFVASRMGCVD